jgi:outer membrane lipoprotein SlyB
MTRTLTALAIATMLVGGANTAQAGCVTGAVVGGIAGHALGHHGLVGAAAGCVVGHEMAVKKKRRQTAERAAARSGRQQGEWSTH